MNSVKEKNKALNKTNELTLQVLVATMHQTDYSLLDRMNIQSDAIIVNQSDHNEIVQFQYRNHDILWITLNERGVGLSRNTALMRATADIVLFADDDIQYTNAYPAMIRNGFFQNPKAHVLVFDMQVVGGQRTSKRITDKHQVKLYNGLGYGMYQYACRRETLMRERVICSLKFGGGAKYGSGEDTIFLTDCIKRHLRVWTCPDCIGTMNQEESTWFHGYNEKYFYDKGVLMKTIFGVFSPFITFLLIWKNKEWIHDFGFWNAYKTALRGIKEDG